MERRWNRVVQEVALDLAQSQSVPAEPRRGRFSRLLFVCFVGCALIVSYVLLAMPRPVAPALNEHEQVMDLAWMIADVVRSLEARRLPPQQLPSPDDIERLLPPGLSFEARADGYRILGRSQGVTLAYDWPEPLDTWLSAVIDSSLADAAVGSPSGK